MNQEELLLWNEREKQRKKRSTDDELDEDLVFENVPKFKQAITRAANTSTDFSVDVQTKDDNYKLSSSLIGNDSLSINTNSPLPSTQTASFKNISSADMAVSAPATAKVQTSSDGTTISSSASNLSSSSFATSPVIANFAIVKMTGADNFFKSAYTVGKGASIRATKAIDYIMRDGAFKDESNEATALRAQKHIDYMSRDEVKDSGGILYDRNGNEISDFQAKSMMQDITGERRLVFSPNSNIKMTNAEFSKVITKTVNTFSQDFHKNFDYTFAIHRNTDNPHAHLILTTKDIGGEGVKMFKDELFELKQRFYENTKQLAIDKSDRYEISYKDKSYFSEAKQIAGFTGDMPTSKFANQNIYLIRKIAASYKLPINEKALNSADKIRDFFKEHNNEYNEFITNAKNRYADTFTKYYKDSIALSQKYDLGEVPKDVEQFKTFIDENQKLFLADKIATDKGLELSSKHLKDDTAINKWFTANKEIIKEWNSENEPRISKELYSRFEQLNTRVDKPFAIPQTRKEGITLNNHYKLDKMIFANDTRKALVDVVEARIKYFQKAAKSHEISKEEKKTNIERLDGLRGKIKAYDDITESSLKKYGIDTSFFSKDEKIVEMDGIKLEHGNNGQKFDALLAKAIQSPEFTPEQKDKIERISHVADKQQQVSVSALENAGFKREELQKEFTIEKIETKQQIINFKRTDEFKELNNTSLKDWKQENLDNYVFLSKGRIGHMVADIENSIKMNELLKGKNIYLDRHIEHVNKNLITLGKSIESKWEISIELALKAGVDTRQAEIITKNKDVEYIPKNSTNDVLMGLFNYKEEIFGKLSEKYNENSLSKGYFKTTLELNAAETKNIEVFDKEIRNTEFDVIKNPMSLTINGETISKSLFETKNFTYDVIKNELSNEHGIEIKSAKDLSSNIDKVGILNPIRGEFANILQLSINANTEIKGNDKFLDNYIDNVNKNIEKLTSKLINGKDITVKDLEQVGVNTNGVQPYEKAYKQDFLISSSENIEKLEFIKNSISEDEFKELKESVQNGTMQVSTLNYLVADKTQDLQAVDINFKPTFDIENKLGQAVEVVKIDSLKNILSQNKLSETISTKLYNQGNYFNKIKEQLSNEHGVEIKNVKDLSDNLDKIGVSNPVRYEFANKLEIIKNLNNELLSDNNDFINKYIGSSNKQIGRLSQKIMEGKNITLSELHKILPNVKVQTYIKDQEVKYISNNDANIEKMQKFLQDSNIFDSKKQYELFDQLKAGELTNYLFNNAISKATEKLESLDVNLRPSFDVVEKSEQLEYVKISSLKNVLTDKELNENISSKILKSDKFFDKIKNELSNEHGVEIKSAKDLSDNFDKIGKPSEFRMLLIEKTNQKIQEFRANNSLQDDSKFEEFRDAIMDKTNALRDKTLDDETRDQNKLSDIEKEYQGLNTLLSKNIGLKPIFESDLRKIGANAIEFKDFTKVNIDVEVIQNSAVNRASITQAFNKLIDQSIKKSEQIELNLKDKQAIDKIFKSEEKLAEFKKASKDYLERASDKSGSNEYISSLSDTKSLQSYKYVINKSEESSIPVNYFASRGVDMEPFVTMIENKEINTIAMWSKENKDIFLDRKQKETDSTLAKVEVQQQLEHTAVNNFTHNRLSQTEIDSLRAATKEQLLYSDPSNVLNSLGLDFTVKQGGSNYSFRLRPDDRTPSASMYLDRGGVWKFKDFGSGESGTIENVVMLSTGMNYKDALNYSLDASGLKNYLAEAIESNQNMAKIQLTAEHLSRLEEIKNINISKAQESNVDSKVLSYREITPNDTKVMEFLSNRGIDSIPKNMYIIEGQISGVGANGKEYSYTNIGVGVLTGDMSKTIDLDKVGADIHFLNPKVLRDGATMKTQSFGSKDITLIPGQNDTKDYAVFESKMDYAAAACKVDLNETNVVIANGVGQVSKIANLLNEQEVEKVTFYNQNDAPGEKFVSDIVDKANIEKFDFVKYEAVGEYKQDINDLVKNGVDIEQRLVSNATVEDWQNYILDNKEAKIENLIEIGEFKAAAVELKNSNLEVDAQERLQMKLDISRSMQYNDEPLFDDFKMQTQKDEQQNEDNQKVKDAALQEKALEDINLEKEQIRNSGMGI